MPKPKYIKSQNIYYDPNTDTIYAPDSIGEFYTHEMFHARPDTILLNELKPYYENLNDNKLLNMGADLKFVKRTDPNHFFQPEELGARVAVARKILKDVDINEEFLNYLRKNENKYGNNVRDLLKMFNNENLIQILNMKNKLIPKHLTPADPLVLQNDNTRVKRLIEPEKVKVDWSKFSDLEVMQRLQERIDEANQQERERINNSHSERNSLTIYGTKGDITPDQAREYLISGEVPVSFHSHNTLIGKGLSPVDPVGEFVVGNAVLGKPLLWLGKGIMYGVGRYLPHTKVGNWSRAKLITKAAGNPRTPTVAYTTPITLNVKPQKTTTKGAMVLQQRSSAKISAFERAGIPKGDRNQPIAPKYNGRRDVHNSLYKGAAKDNRDLPYTLKDIDGADSYVAENMRYSNKQAKRDFTNKYEQISERYLGNPDNLDKFNSTLSDYIKTLPGPDDMFLNSNGWQSAYVLDYRKYLYNLGYDAADISDYDLAKLISLLYRDLTATMTGKTKGMVMWHGSPKMFDRFDLTNTGKYTGNMGYGGPGNYFSNARTRYGYTEENGVLNLQPYLITNVQSTPPMTIMQDKGLIPYYLSPKDYRAEEYKLIVLNLIKKTPIDDNKLYIDDISALPVGSLDPINGIRAEYLLRRNDGIKSLFPHPSLFVRNADGSVAVIRNWLDPRVNYKQGGQLIPKHQTPFLPLGVDNMLENKYGVKLDK